MTHKTNVESLWSSQMGSVIQRQQELAGNAYVTGQSLEDMRTAYNEERKFWNEGGPVMAEIKDTYVSTCYGDVQVRIYRPSFAAQLPAIVFLHGGGWVLGNLDTHDRITRHLAYETEAVVIAVNYSLAPEARYPRAVEQCAAVIAELGSAATRWGFDPGDVSLAGDSAGASLCLGSWLFLRDQTGLSPVLRSLLLFYGAYGLRDSKSKRLLGGPWDGLSEADWQWYMELYLNTPADLHASYIDLLANDLSEIPPCFILSAGLDPLKDDSSTLAEMLSNVGRTHKYIEVPGVIHGFLHYSRMLPEAEEAIKAGAKYFLTQRSSP